MRDAEGLLELHLSEHSSLELIRTVFKLRRTDPAVVGIRGTQVPPGAIPFRWSPTVQALTLFFVKAATIQNDEDLLKPCLQGKSPSPATSIAGLILRQSMGGYLDIFGTDTSGRSNFYRLISACNHIPRSAQPLQLYLRTPPLSPTGIKVFVNDEEITGKTSRLVALADKLNASWQPGNSGRELRLIKGNNSQNAPTMTRSAHLGTIKAAKNS